MEGGGEKKDRKERKEEREEGKGKTGTLQKAYVYLHPPPTV